MSLIRFHSWAGNPRGNSVWITAELEGVNYIMKSLGTQNFDEGVMRQGIDDLVAKLGHVENHLKTNTYLAGYQITIADTLLLNACDKNEALDFFQKNYDPEGFQIWFIKYIKYEGEVVKLYLTSNLKDSLMQRLEYFRKNCFVFHGVYGEEGIWVWRSLYHPQQIQDFANYEYHTYERLDHTNESHNNQFWTGLQNDVSVADQKFARDVGYFK